MRSKKSPDGRDRRTFIEQARRQQFVRCAIETLAEVGYARASLAEIAQRAGTSKSVILYHFTDRSELIDQVVREVYEAGTAHVESRVGAAPTAADALRAYLAACIAFVRDNPRELAALSEIVAGARADDGTHRYTSPDNGPVASAEAILRRGQGSGEFRQFDTHTMARVIRCALDDVAARYAADPSLDLDACTRELSVLFELATTNRSSST